MKDAAAAVAAYKQRAYEQGKLWVQGSSTHNEIDDECCPDFSCCKPSLFDFSRERRVYTLNRWAERNGFPKIEDA